MNTQHDKSVCYKSIVFIILLYAHLSFAQSKWEWRVPLPQGNTLTSITYGKGTFVAVGEVGTVVTSINNKNWTLENSGIDYTLNDIKFTNNQFIAVGDYGVIFDFFIS